LRLRSIRASGDWEAYWRHHEQQELQRNHVARYAGGTIPALTSPRPTSRPPNTRQLRVVK